MAYLGHDIILLIAEQLDSASLVSFMLTCKANHRLIMGHERSITKARITTSICDPILWPPFGTVLSSSPNDRRCLDREVLGPLSFAVAKELEMRARRINNLFSTDSTTSSRSCGQSLTEALSRIIPFRDLPSSQMERLVDGLRGACMVADRIADCAAVVHANRGTEVGRGNNEAWIIEHEVHLARQRYIRSLPPIRLAFLTLLAGLVGAKYAQDLPRLDSDPLRWERVTAFKETVLRYGTLVIHALLCPSEPDATATSDADSPGPSYDLCRPPYAQSQLARFYASEVDGVLRELLEYEATDWGSSGPVEDKESARHIPDSLHMTMLQAFPGPQELADKNRRREVAEEKNDGDGSGLGDEAGNQDPRDALILKWTKEQ